MNNDLISRSALIKWIDDSVSQYGHTYSTDMLNMWGLFKDYLINNAPTVSFMISPDYVTELQNRNKELIKQLEELERTHGEWISAEDKLPEDRKCVLVTAYWHETYQVMQASYFGEGEKNGWWCVPWNNCGDHMRNDLHVIAWRPLPKPYKKGGNDND